MGVGIGLGGGEGGNFGFFLPGPLGPDRESGYANDAILRADGVEGFRGFFSKADNALGIIHDRTIPWYAGLPNRAENGEVGQGLFKGVDTSHIQRS